MKIHKGGTPAEDCLGKKYGRLTVLREIKERDKHRNRLVECVCECGTVKRFWLNAIRSGQTASCGCLQKEFMPRTHGMYRNPAYGCWRAMISRCMNANNPNYDSYGGAGIRIYEPWINDPALFFLHIGDRPSPKHSIDRIDTSGDYVPGNVRWALPVTQARNT